MSDWVMHIVDSAGYPGLIMLMFVENVFPPIPSELILPLAGYMAAQGMLTLTGVIAAGTAGSVLGALPLYYLGRAVGEERLKRMADRYGRWLAVSRADLDWAGGWFHRHGGKAVFLCRMIPGLRSLISIPAGIAGMSLLPFLLYTAIGSALWSALLAWLGYYLGNNFAIVSHYLDPVSWIVVGIILAAYIIRVIRVR